MSMCNWTTSTNNIFELMFFKVSILFVKTFLNTSTGVFSICTTLIMTIWKPIRWKKRLLKLVLIHIIIMLIFAQHRSMGIFLSICDHWLWKLTLSLLDYIQRQSLFEWIIHLIKIYLTLNMVEVINVNFIIVIFNLTFVMIWLAYWSCLWIYIWVMVLTILDQWWFLIFIIHINVSLIPTRTTYYWFIRALWLLSEFSWVRWMTHLLIEVRNS